MNKSLRVLVGLAILLAVVAASGCTKLKARDQLNKGVQSYKNARYEEAIGHFQNAVAQDPALLNARLYLATAYAQQFVPGVDSEDNKRNANSAIEQFKKVLDTNPPHEAKVASLKGIASLYFNMKDMNHAKEYQQKVIQEDPNDAEAYYSVGVIDWTGSYAFRQAERAKLGLKPTEDLKDKKVCALVKQKNEAAVEDGLASLKKAMQLRADYDDAMAYMNLMYRERADYECDDQAAREKDKKSADEMVDQSLAAKKRKADKQGTGGIVLDQTK